MDLDKRIGELEEQVRELTEVVRDLLAERRTEAAPAPNRAAGQGVATPCPTVSQAVVPKARRDPRRDVRGSVDRVLGGERGDTLETRIGGIWLSRVAAVLFMTAVVLGARVTVYSEVLGPVQKLLIVYGASACAIAYGIGGWRSRSFFPQTLLGTGLAGVYFATYGAFFVAGMQITSDRAFAIPLLVVCLALLAGVSHVRRSQTVAGIALFLVYYTVVASCVDGGNAQNMYYALLTCAILAVVALAFHAAHRWLLFTWAALIATHATYLYFFAAKPAGLLMPDGEYFWLSNGFLSLCYVAFSCACLIDARKTGEYRRGIASMAGVNSFVYFVLTWVAIRHLYVEYEWGFRLALAALLLAFTILAETTGPRRNYLFQIFAAKTVIMFTLALQAYLSGEKLMVAMAIECLALSISYKRSGIVTFKVLGLGLLIVTFVGSLVHVKTSGTVSLGAYRIPSNWFCCVGSALALMIVAWFYERFVRRVKREHRIASGQWFLADTFLDVPSATAALLHAAAAALIVLTITIIDRGADLRLPYLLAGEGVLMALAGLALRTPQVQVGGVLLLVASHVCYHAFLAMGKSGFETQGDYVPYTVLVALFTYAGAYLWERYLRRVEGGRPWEHNVVAAIPYLAATYMLTTLLGRQFAGIHVPLAQNALGVALLLTGVVTRYPGVKASGLLAFGIGGVMLGGGLYVIPESFATQPGFFVNFSVILATYAVAERLFVVLQSQERAPSRDENLLRTLLVAVAAAFGAGGFSRYAGGEYLTLYWLALALAAVILGAAFRESRYRWAALALFGAAIGRAFVFDLRKLQPFYQFLSFATLSAALLVVSWAYARYRQRTLKRNATESGSGAASDG